MPTVSAMAAEMFEIRITYLWVVCYVGNNLCGATACLTSQTPVNVRDSDGSAGQARFLIRNSLLSNYLAGLCQTVRFSDSAADECSDI